MAPPMEAADGKGKAKMDEMAMMKGKDDMAMKGKGMDEMMMMKGKKGGPDDMMMMMQQMTKGGKGKEDMMMVMKGKAQAMGTGPDR